MRRRFSVLYEYKETVIYGFFFLKKITKKIKKTVDKIMISIIMNKQEVKISLPCET